MVLACDPQVESVSEAMGMVSEIANATDNKSVYTHNGINYICVGSDMMMSISLN